MGRQCGRNEDGDSTGLCQHDRQGQGARCSRGAQVSTLDSMLTWLLMYSPFPGSFSFAEALLRLSFPFTLDLEIRYSCYPSP